MKRIIILLLGFFLIASCSKDDDDKNIFKGEDFTPDKTIGKVGNYWDIKVRGLDIDGKVAVTSNNEGVTEFKLEVNNLATALGEITYKGEKIDFNSPLTLRAKISTNTIATYDYGSTGTDNPFILVKFDGKKGDKYTFKSGDKTTIREITDDNFEVDAFGLVIKAFQIKETLPENTLTIKTKTGQELQVSYITYLVNHRFGLVNVMIYLKGYEGFPYLIVDALKTNCDTKK